MLAAVETCTIYMVYDYILGVMYELLWRVSGNGEIKTVSASASGFKTDKLSVHKTAPFHIR